MNNEENLSINEKIDIGVRKGAAKARAEHKKAGRSIYIWQDGKVVEVPPERIPVNKTELPDE